MSIQRQFRRRFARKMGQAWDGPSPPFRLHPDGGYEVAHPTKGWRRFSARRLRAQARLRALSEHLAARRAA